MSIHVPPDGSIELCIDQLGEFIETLPDCTEPVLAHALRVHLGALLHAMLDDGQCTRAQISEFVQELEHEALDDGA